MIARIPDFFNVFHFEAIFIGPTIIIIVATMYPNGCGNKKATIIVIQMQRQRLISSLSSLLKTSFFIILCY